MQVAPGHDISGDRIYAVVQHLDGTVEDVWGRQSAEAVARRYAMVRWALDAQAHCDMIEEAYRVRPAAADDVAEADAVIRQYRVRTRASIFATGPIVSCATEPVSRGQSMPTRWFEGRRPKGQSRQ